ncbi:OmpA family protein [Flavobacterium antarcticum]|uniref:OmpA family protein n=1 Tax=Flavobacterium antarcticum TaxID=271155 RepID=UPI0003B69949|nr:OmpA family protein [Flavobacterium antarcticum]
MKSKINWVFVLFLFGSLISSAQEQFSVYFETNKFDLIPTENQKLLEWISANPKVKIVAINGFTDKDGLSEMNDTLAQKRVDFIYKCVENKITIRSDFKTISFGEKHVQNQEKSKNRRVDVFYILEKDLARENEILGITEEIKIQKTKAEIRYPDSFQVQNPNGTVSEYALDTNFMQKITTAKSGEKLQLEHLNFIFNTFAITNDSRGKLYELLLVMMQNPQLKIEVQGHICCNSSNKETLSTQRAKAIKGFLKSQGIDTSRVTFKGFGSTQPLYPLPEKNEQERAANRRVEILIIEN